MDDGHGGDGIPHGTHPFVKLIFGLVGADDGPRRTVVDHFLIGFFWTRSGLEHSEKRGNEKPIQQKF